MNRIIRNTKTGQEWNIDSAHLEGTSHYRYIIGLSVNNTAYGWIMHHDKRLCLIDFDRRTETVHEESSEPWWAYDSAEETFIKIYPYQSLQLVPLDVKPKEIDILEAIEDVTLLDDMPQPRMSIYDAATELDQEVKNKFWNAYVGMGKTEDNEDCLYLFLPSSAPKNAYSGKWTHRDYPVIVRRTGPVKAL